MVFPRTATVCGEAVVLRMTAVRIRIHIVFLQLVAVCREIVFPRMAVRLREDSYFANGEIVFPRVAATRWETVALRMAAVRIRIHLFDMISSTARCDDMVNN